MVIARSAPPVTKTSEPAVTVTVPSFASAPLALVVPPMVNLVGFTPALISSATNEAEVTAVASVDANNVAASAASKISLFIAMICLV